MDIFLQELFQTFRELRRRPVFTLVTVLSLALGIGALTAVFTIANTLLFRPLPFADEGELLRLQDVLERPGEEPRETSMAALNYDVLRQRTHVFEGLALQDEGSFNLLGGDEPVRVMGAYVSANTFPVLGVKPVLGRGIAADEDQTGAPAPVVVLSYELWQRQLGGREDILGQDVVVNDEPHTVVGVMPPGYRYPYDAQLWVPLGFDVNNPRASHYLHVVGRLRDGATREQARQELDAIASQLAAEHPDTNTDWKFLTLPIREEITGELDTSVIWLLVAAAGFLLLIACANAASMLLARSTERAAEVALRSVLGSSRVRLVGRMVLQGLVLALLGGGLGLVLAYTLLGPVVRLSPIADIYIFASRLTPDLRVLGFTLAVCAVVGVLFSLIPALHASRVDLQSLLKEESRGSLSSGGRRWLAAFVVAEVAVATVLLVGAFLMVGTFERLVTVDAGFEPDKLLVGHLALSSSKYPEDVLKVQFLDQLRQRLEALPGVRAAGVSTLFPLDGVRMISPLSIEGRPPENPGDDFVANFRMVSVGYLEALGVPVVSGRFFEQRDMNPSPPAFVVSRSLAERFWPGEDAVGRQMKRAPWDLDRPWGPVVGVVENVIDSGDTEDTLYIPYTHFRFINDNVTLVVRTEGDALAALPSIRRTIQEIDPQQPLYDVATAREMIASSHGNERFAAVLLTSFAALGLALALMGIYGILTYSVASRSRELGLRMALGAQRGEILWQVVRQGLTVTGIGLVLGLAGSFLLTRLLQAYVYDLDRPQPSMLVGIAVLVLAVSMLAAFLPSRRATRLDPATVLRGE
ncbi:MAG: ABC transporter permease [Acidobacteria bacterium]|nr:ABC transporter permease [Acidobacteriota bacterium]